MKIDGNLVAQTNFFLTDVKFDRFKLSRTHPNHRKLCKEVIGGMKEL